MNRNITVSTDVFAAIWAHREAGEDSEDSILRRLLGCESTPGPLNSETPSEKEIGFADKRNGVNFPHGFTIYRTYKGKDYAAIAVGNTWQREDNGKRYASLNQLNGSIADGNENVWNGNWKFRDSDGTLKSIALLRA